MKFTLALGVASAIRLHQEDASTTEAYATLVSDGSYYDPEAANWTEESEEECPYSGDGSDIIYEEGFELTEDHIQEEWHNFIDEIGADHELGFRRGGLVAWAKAHYDAVPEEERYGTTKKQWAETARNLFKHANTNSDKRVDYSEFAAVAYEVHDHYDGDFEEFLWQFFPWEDYTAPEDENLDGECPYCDGEGDLTSEIIEEEFNNWAADFDGEDITRKNLVAWVKAHYDAQPEEQKMGDKKHWANAARRFFDYANTNDDNKLDLEEFSAVAMDIAENWDFDFEAYFAQFFWEAEE